MATDWVTGKSGQFNLGTDNGTTSAWAVMRFEWVEEYSPSTAKHRITITPKAKTSVANLANGEAETSSHYIIGTVQIGGTTVFSHSLSNVATFFYSTGAFYNFTDATDSYKIETWTSPEFSGNSVSVSISLTLVPASYYWNNQTFNTIQTLTLTSISTTAMSTATCYVWNGGWVQATPYIWDGGWKLASGYGKKS